MFTERFYAMKRRTMLILFFVLIACLNAENVLRLRIDADSPGKYALESPEKVSTCYYRTLSPYGHLRGERIWGIQEGLFPQLGVDRKGEFTALRLGTNCDSLQIPLHITEEKKYLSIALWVYLYDAKPGFQITLLSASSFNVCFGMAHYARNGMIVFSCFHGGGKPISKTPFHPGKWHYLVVNLRPEGSELYIDGEFVGKQNSPDYQKLVKCKTLFIGNRNFLKKATEFKLDEISVSDRALSAGEVKANWEKGQPVPFAGSEMENEMENAVLAIPRNTNGYFMAGEKIPVERKLPAFIDAVSVNGKQYRAPFTEIPPLVFESPGVYDVELGMLSKGRVLRKIHFPVGIRRFSGTDSSVGVADIPSCRQEALSAGIRKTTVQIPWGRIETQKGVFDWRYLDRIAEFLTKNRMDAVFQIRQIPHWYRKMPNVYHNPEFFNAFEKFIKYLIARYPEIRFWQIGNEFQSLNPGKRDAAGYTKVLKSASAVLKKENSANRVIAWEISHMGDVNIFNQSADHSSFDIIGIQTLYSVLDAPWIKAIQNPGKKPVWNMSCGYFQIARSGQLPLEDVSEYKQMPGYSDRFLQNGIYQRKILTEKRCAARTVQELAVRMAEGAERCYLQKGPSSYEPAGTPTDGAPGWVGIALSAFQHFVPQGSSVQPAWPDRKEVHAYSIRTPSGKNRLLVYSPVSRKINLPPEIGTAYGLFGEDIHLENAMLEVGESPVYLEYKE